MDNTILATTNINDANTVNFVIWELTPDDLWALEVAQANVAALNREVPGDVCKSVTAMRLNIGRVTALSIEPENEDRLDDPVFAKSIYRHYEKEDLCELANYYAMINENGFITLYLEEPEDYACECVEQLPLQALRGNPDEQSEITWLVL